MPQHKKSIHLYYFSGTGNARRATDWIAEIARQKGYDVKVTNIAKSDRVHIEKPEPGTLIGFCSPTHGFNYPPVMVNFLIRFPRANGNSVFTLNTRAGMKLGKIFLPGLSGPVHLMASIILLLKGYRLIGMQAIDLPSNWISLHPGLRAKVVDSIFQRCERITKRFAEKILSQKKSFRALRDIIQDLAISPLSIGYYFLGRFFIAKTFIANDSCDRCDHCIRSCPVKAIHLIDKRPFWTIQCESCMNCMNHCPKRAIETAHGFITGAIILAGFLWGLLMVLFPSSWITEGEIPWTLAALWNIAEWLFSLLLVMILYFFAHYMLKIPALRQLIVLSSFTHYKFWRRYRAPRHPNADWPIPSFPSDQGSGKV